MRCRCKTHKAVTTWRRWKHNKKEIAQRTAMQQELKSLHNAMTRQGAIPSATATVLPATPAKDHPQDVPHHDIGRGQADWLWDIVRPIRMPTSPDSYSPKGRYHALRLVMAIFPGSSSRWTTRSVVSPTSFAQAVVGALPAALPSFASDRRRVATAHIPSPTRCPH